MDRVREGDLSPAKAGFDVVERLLQDGDKETQKVAVIGFIEALQNSAANSGYDEELFLPFLGPLTAAEWESLEQRVARRMLEGLGSSQAAASSFHFLLRAALPAHASLQKTTSRGSDDQLGHPASSF
jgi:hypothetical protein